MDVRRVIVGVICGLVSPDLRKVLRVDGAFPAAGMKVDDVRRGGFRHILAPLRGRELRDL